MISFSAIEIRENFVETRLMCRRRCNLETRWVLCGNLSSVVPFLKSPAFRHLKKQFFDTSAYTIAMRGMQAMTFVKIPSAHLKYFMIPASPLTCNRHGCSRMPDVNSHEFANNSARIRNKFLPPFSFRYASFYRSQRGPSDISIQFCCRA